MAKKRGNGEGGITRHKKSGGAWWAGSVADMGEKSTWPWTCASLTDSIGCSGLVIWRRLPPHNPGGVPCWGVQAEARDTTVLTFPKFDYYLDESDPDLVVLRRHDGAFVAAFSARGATREGMVEAAKEDYRELIQTHANSLAWESEEHRSA
jgi:hypothetical protein